MTDRRRYSSARTEDSYNYSDDFSDDDTMPVKSAPEKQRIRGRGRSQSKGRGRGRGQGRQSQARSDTQVDVVTKHLLSASRLKMNELQNQLEDMKKQMKIVTDENKLYKRMQYKQEKALVKFEDRESELPQMIQAHNNEVRSLREQLRRTREKYEKTDRYLRDAEDELERVNTKCKKYKNLADQKDLGERSDLDRRLNKAELSIEEKECRIRELERHMEMLKKNHRHELGIERARSKDAQKQLEEIKDTNVRLEAVLREKEKQLDAKNIYSNRFGKPSSYNGTPAESPAPWRQSLKKKSESMSDLAARDKARAYETKRKAADDKKKEKLHLPKLHLSPKKQVEKPPQKPPAEPRQKWEDEDREKEESTSGPNFNFKSLPRQDSDADFWRRQEERFKQDKDNREKQEEERRKKAEEEKQEEARFQQQREKFQRDMEERERRLRESQDQEEERERQRQREKRQREEKEKEEQERRDAEQRERDRKEQERRRREEQEKLDNDPRLAEERRKKDELLRRLQQLDANRDGSQPSADPFAPSDSTRCRVGGDPPSDPFAPSPGKRADRDDPFAPSSGKRADRDFPFAPSPSKRADRDPFSVGGGDSSFSSPGSKKDYAFTRPVENLHQGKPAHDDVSLPHVDRQKRAKAGRDDDGVGGYQPSFSGPRKASGSGKKKKPLSLFDDEEVKPTPKPDVDKKSKLMSDLFGSQAAAGSSSSKKDDGDGFFLTEKSPPPRQQTQSKRSAGFPWDGSSSATKTNGSAHQESSTLFAGGAALVDDDINGSSGPKSNLLPKRSRQPTTTFNSKPAMVVEDDLDDDIEEVVL